MNLRDTLARVHDEEALFRQAWQRTRAAWVDTRGQRFERDHVESLLNEMRTYEAALDALERTATQVSRTLQL